MVMFISGADSNLYPNLFKAAGELRHRVFIDEMQWEGLNSADGQEWDQFDTDSTVHQFVVRNNELVGYQRANITTKPHLLSEVFPELCEGDFPIGSDTYEVSRYCVAPSCRQGRRSQGAVGSEVIAGMVAWSMKNSVNHSIYQFEPAWILRGIQFGFLVHPLGFPQKIGTQQVIAAKLTHNSNTLDTIKERAVLVGNILETPVDLSDTHYQAEAS